MKKYILPLLLLCLLCTGCGGPISTEKVLTAPLDSERLVVYTSHKAEVYEPLIQEFEERTGVWVSVVTGGTNELLEKIAIEADAPRCDVMFGGGVESLEAYNEYFQSYDTGDVCFAYDNRLADSKWVQFSSLPVVLICNSRLLDAQTLPDSWQAMLGGQYKGQIAFASPAVSGSAYTALQTMAQALNKNSADVLAELVDSLQGRVLSDSGDVVDAVAGGRYLVGITLEETAQKGIAAGKDILMIYPKEGTSAVPDGAAVINDCAHQKNAKLFMQFILSEDVQGRLSDVYYRRSVRKDLFGNAQSEELPVIDYDISLASREKAALLAAWRSAEAK